MKVRTGLAGSGAAREAATAYPLLTFTALLWAGNTVAGKWATGEVSPQVLTTLRWVIGFAVLAIVARRPVAASLSTLAPRWRYIIAMGTIGYTAYASLFYLAGTQTRAINVALFQGAIPVLVMLLNYIFRHVGVTRGQFAGVVVTLAGAIVAATHGDWNVLRTFAFNVGDVMMLVACLLYAGFTVGLTARPNAPALAFFTAMAAAAAVTSLPPLALEWATGHLIWPTPTGWVIVAFVALGPTLIAQLWYMRGVELIGPNRAGLFVNLVPIFGAILAVLLVGEPFGLTEALALVLVIGGIAIAEGFRARSA